MRLWWPPGREQPLCPEPCCQRPRDAQPAMAEGGTRRLAGGCDRATGLSRESSGVPVSGRVPGAWAGVPQPLPLPRCSFLAVLSPSPSQVGSCTAGHAAATPLGPWVPVFSVHLLSDLLAFRPDLLTSAERAPLLDPARGGGTRLHLVGRGAGWAGAWQGDPGWVLCWVLFAAAKRFLESDARGEACPEDKGLM